MDTKESIHTTLPKPELLAPVGDFDCLRAAVQNGADAVYFGGNLFNARNSAKNFSISELKEVIQYAKLRNVKTNLTLNTLLTNEEFMQAVLLAQSAYEFGIDAIIVQDFGFANYLIHNFPELEVHGSTQMTIHNLEGALALQDLGFKRVVLSRELPINEIEYIRNHCNIELEVFVHGALCICYSGQCLFSSLVGGRSGNRGKCAQPCRLPYELLQKNGEDFSTIDKGYLLSPRDLCGIPYLPSLINMGIHSFKVEGRLKPPEYVAIVTKIYRKYIDTVYNNPTAEFQIDPQDQKDLLQVFNRGGFSTGHFDTEANRNLIFSEKPNNMGIYLGNIANYQSSKGIITLNNKEEVSMGDTISIEKETGTYTISELMVQDQNVKTAPSASVVKLGRMKGNISIGDKVYKMSNKVLWNEAKQTYLPNCQLKKSPIDASITIKEGTPIRFSITFVDDTTSIKVIKESSILPVIATNQPLTADRVIQQLSKTNTTPYYFNAIHVYLDENVYVPSMNSTLNSLRRDALKELEQKRISGYERACPSLVSPFQKSDTIPSDKKVHLYLQELSDKLNYLNLDKVDAIYLPLKYVVNKRYAPILDILIQKAPLYVAMPAILKNNYKNLLLNNLEDVLAKYPIKGFVISSLADLTFLKSYISSYHIIANTNLNVFNAESIAYYQTLGVQTVTLSQELNKKQLKELLPYSPLTTELVVYGRTILMNMSYCLLGKTNKCYPECDAKCINDCTYYLKDRLSYLFRIIPDNIQTVTSIYNSKITSIDHSDIPVDSVRIDILEESIEEINSIMQTIRSGKKLEGPAYTNGNLNKEI